MLSEEATNTNYIVFGWAWTHDLPLSKWAHLHLHHLCGVMNWKICVYTCGMDLCDHIICQFKMWKLQEIWIMACSQRNVIEYIAGILTFTQLPTIYGRSWV